jgi:uncharacterized coiled-coil DUF342 family protein
MKKIMEKSSAEWYFETYREKVQELTNKSEELTDELQKKLKAINDLQIEINCMKKIITM